MIEGTDVETSDVRVSCEIVMNVERIIRPDLIPPADSQIMLQKISLDG
jgi:hypothetical protein